MTKNKKLKLYLIALVPFLVLVLLFEILPLMMIIIRSFMVEDGIGFTFKNYLDIFTKRLYQQAIINSVLVSIVSALIGLIIAFFGAKAAHSSRGKLKTFFISILNMTSNFAGLPLAFAYIIMFGSVGVWVLIGKKYGIEFLANFQLYSLSGLMLTFVYFQIPLAILLLIPAFEILQKQWKESVALLGGNNLTYWFKVGIPILLPSILGTLSVLFSNAISAYATAYALLQNNFSLLPIRISEQFVGDVVQRKEFGSALAVVLMLLMVFAIYINNLILRNSKVGTK